MDVAELDAPIGVASSRLLGVFGRKGGGGRGCSWSVLNKGVRLDQRRLLEQVADPRGWPVRLCYLWQRVEEVREDPCASLGALHKGDHLAGHKKTPRDEDATVVQANEERELADRMEEGLRHGLQQVHLAEKPCLVLLIVRVSLQLPRLPREGADGADAAEHLLRLARRGLCSPLHPLVELLQPPHEEQVPEERDRQHGERGGHEARIRRQQRQQVEDQKEAELHEPHWEVQHLLADLLGVAVQPQLQLPAAVGVEEGHVLA
mmetsp:Transcript_125925/g.367928  ORF Transcript_125925/g.367928 Transcript_125925/m.367928 type:complete len:262 (-) Transcript_125925:842-1627(-)